jgi:hypothetical protein
MPLNDGEIDGFKLPSYTNEDLVLWIVKHVPPEDNEFLLFVLNNDLRAAVLHADDENFRALPYIVQWLYNYAPAGCWGSPAKYDAWLKG